MRLTLSAMTCIVLCIASVPALGQSQAAGANERSSRSRVGVGETVILDFQLATGVQSDPILPCADSTRSPRT